MSCFTDVYDTFEEDVFRSYVDVIRDFNYETKAPDLGDIYLAYFCTILDNIHDVYEEVFGAESIIKDEWLNDLGVDRDDIPDILQVCCVLNYLKLGYVFNDVLYNYMQQPLLIEERVVEDVI